MSESTVNGLAWQAPDALARAVRDEIAAWKKDGRMTRLWARDKSVWSSDDEDKWLGWLAAIDRERQIKGWTRRKKEALIRYDYEALPGLASRKQR